MQCFVRCRELITRETTVSVVVCDKAKAARPHWHIVQAYDQLSPWQLYKNTRKWTRRVSRVPYLPCFYPAMSLIPTVPAPLIPTLLPQGLGGLHFPF